MNEVVDCIRCGNLFQSRGRSICFDCKRKEDNLVLEIRRYIRRNPNASADEICEAIKVSMDQLSGLIDEGRIVMRQSESPLSCQICGQSVSRGKICAGCAADLSDGLEVAKEPAEKKQQVTTRYFNNKKR